MPDLVKILAPRAGAAGSAYLSLIRSGSCAAPGASASSIASGIPSSRATTGAESPLRVMCSWQAVTRGSRRAK
jgi:hypothetical protein